LLLLTILEEKGFLRPWQRGEQTDIRVFQKIAICPVDALKNFEASTFAQSLQSEAGKG
jgi:hypothetical protein